MIIHRAVRHDIGMQMATQTRAYGEWTSPIVAADVAQAQVGLSFPTVDANGVWWQESRPAEGGRLAIGCQPADGGSRYTPPRPWNARNRVHEYGGKSYLTLPGGFLFANFGDQRLYRCQLADPDGPPEPLTPAPTDAVADRYADYTLSPAGDEVWCVRERHADGAVRRAIVAIPLDGSAADTPDAIRVLVGGSSDFYAFPSPSPDGTRLAWISWDHPRMPWDGSELRVTTLGAGPGEYQVLMGGDTESVVAPVWRDDQSLYVISDRSDCWNLYLVDLAGSARALCPREEEFAAPLWQLGQSPYVVLGDGRIAAVHGTGEPRLSVLEPGSGELTDLDLPYSLFSLSLSAAGQTVIMVAGGPAQPAAVVAVDVPTSGPAAQVREGSSSGSQWSDPPLRPRPP